MIILWGKSDHGNSNKAFGLGGFKLRMNRSVYLCVSSNIHKTKIMKIFISWSGTLSKQIGEVFKDWLPGVLQNVKPYFTPSDIDKGSRWGSDISKELESSKIGIFIYTRDNLNSQWMLFEAGAISKTLGNSKVCPILFGLDNSDFKGPLTQFQTSQFDKHDFKKLVISINNSSPDVKLDDKILDNVFEMWWPKLENKISHILEKEKVDNGNLRDDRELIEEILELSRSTLKRVSLGSHTKVGKKYDESRFLELVNEFVSSTLFIFDLDWGHTRACMEDINTFVNSRGTFLEPKVDDEGSNWGNRPGFLMAFRRLNSFMQDNEITDRGGYFDSDVALF